MSDCESSDDEFIIPTLDEIMSWKKKQMEQWLMDRQLPRSSKRKEVLAQRILRHIVGDEEEDDVSSDENEPSPCHVIYPLVPGVCTCLFKIQIKLHFHS